MKMAGLLPFLLFFVLTSGVALSDTPIEEESLPAKTEQIINEKERAENLREELVRNEQLIAEIEQVRSSRGIGNLLRNMQAELPAAATYRTRLREIQEEMDRAREQRIQLRGILVELSSTQPVRRPVLGRDMATSPALARKLTKEQASETESLIGQYQQYEGALRELYFAQDALLSQIAKTKQALAERMLWLRGRPLSSDALKAFLPSVEWVVRPANWQSVAKTLRADIRWAPLSYIFVALLVLLAVKLRTRFTDSHSGFLQLFDAFLRALPVPLALGFIGYRLAISPESENFSVAIGQGLVAGAALLLVILCFRNLANRDGFFTANTSLSAEQLRSVRGSLPILAAILVPSVLILVVVEIGGTETIRYSLGRIALLISLLCAIVFVRLTLWPKKWDWTEGSRSERLKRSLSPLFLIVCFVLMLMGVVGYYDAALILANRLVITLFFLFALFILDVLLSHWLVAKMRHLAIAKIRHEQLQGETQRPEDDLVPEASGIIGRQEESEIATVGTQTFHLLRVFLGIGLILGLWWIWGDILPALKFLGDFKIWEVAQTVGNKTTQRIITLTHLVLAVVILVAMVAANRNLPGLLDVAILQHMAVEPATRYAIKTIIRYLIILLGILGVFRVLGIGWNDVRWLVAAVSVGLGFGLQEIFANFISGLIILFERPVRIGDVVTIGGVTGKVTRIRIRATTILDWEHKELIIPNKEFITGMVLNWTLSDSVVRLSARVRVPYGTDIEAARQILLGVADAHPNILKDPNPVASVSEFGDTTVTLDLFAHLPSLENFMKTKNEVYREIDKAFTREGIDFTWLQREMRMRQEREAREQGQSVVQMKEGKKA